MRIQNLISRSTFSSSVRKIKEKERVNLIKNIIITFSSIIQVINTYFLKIFIYKVDKFAIKSISYTTTLIFATQRETRLREPWLSSTRDTQED
jgi:hypothetical protein